ncbi:DUF6585 family protein [Nocardia sp. NPDC020380]|uniref:DUF6585 family protein n=1 Tax=Nocardia sp. NPDC020380 TaxID=3364309 RepID=UPI0037BBA569
MDAYVAGLHCAAGAYWPLVGGAETYGEHHSAENDDAQDAEDAFSTRLFVRQAPSLPSTTFAGPLSPAYRDHRTCGGRASVRLRWMGFDHSTSGGVVGQSSVQDAENRPIADASARAGLGERVAVYLPTPANWRAIQRMSLAFVVLVVITVVGFAVHVELIEAAMYPAIILGLAIVMSTIQGVYYGNRNEGVRLELFEHGLIFFSRNGLRTVRYATAEVIQDLVKNQRTGRVTQTYTLRDVEGNHFAMREGLAKPEEWGPRIQEAVAVHQMPAALAALQAGRQLDFREISMNVNEVRQRNTVVPWAEISGLEITKGSLLVKTADNRPAILTDIRAVSNFNLVYALIKRFSGVQQ